MLGSRDATKATAAAAELNGLLGAAGIEGLDNASAAARGDVIVLAVPFAVQHATALAVRDQLTGRYWST